MKRHIAATPRCKFYWEKDIMGAASNTKVTRKSLTPHLEHGDSAFDNLDTWDDLHAFVPEESPEPACVEEADGDESAEARQNPDTKTRRFVKVYPRPVGVPIGQGKTKFQLFNEMHTAQGESIYTPFTDEEEWGLAQWLSRHVGQTAIDEYLKLLLVSPKGFFIRC
jgi:hypothetical protein